MSERINLYVKDGIPAKLESLAGGKQKMGAWLSDLVSAMHSSDQVAGDDLYSLRLGHQGLIGVVKHIDARLARLEAGTIPLTER